MALTAMAGPVAPLGAQELLVFLVQVGMLLGLAIVLGRLATLLRMPAVVGELCAGVLVGPSILGHLAPGLSSWLLPTQPAQFHLLDAVGQLGVLLLVGITGIHVDFALLRRRSLDAARVSLFGLVVPLAFGVACGLLLPATLLADGADRGVFAAFLGVAMCVSAIPVIAKTLMDMNLLHRNVGQLTLTAGMVDDAIGWLLLSVVSAMATVGVSTGKVAIMLLSLCLVLAAAVAARPAVRTILARTADPGATTSLIVVMVLLSAAGTHALGLEPIFGAFLCGLVVSSVGGIDPARLVPLRTLVLSVLAPVFFATAGLRVDLAALTQPTVLLAGLVVLTVAIVGKFLGAFLGARLSRLNRWEALALGAGMNARGVVEVVVAMAGLRLGVLNTATYTIIVLVAIVTSLMAPPILRFAMARVEHTAEEMLREKAFI